MSTEQITSQILGSPEAEVVRELEESDAEEISIEVVDDRPEEDRNRIPPKVEASHSDELKDVSKSVRKRMDKLRYDYHEERRSKEEAHKVQNEAVRYAQGVVKENQQLRQLLNRGEQALIQEAQARATAEVDTAKEQVRKALDEGDSENIVSAQEALGKATFDAKRAGEYKPVTSTNVHPNPQQVQQAQQAQRAQQAQQAKPRPDARAVAWAEKNTWFNQDREMRAFALGVHETLIAEERLDPTSDTYYERVDAKMRERFPEKFEGGSEAGSISVETSVAHTDDASRKPSTVVAPARREGRGPSQKVKLLRSQVQLAKKLGVTPENYAKHLLLLEKQSG